MKMKKFVVLLSVILILSMMPTVAFAEETLSQQEIAQKWEAAIDCMEEQQGDVELMLMPNGNGYAKQIYDLGDGAMLTIEFEDGEDGFKSYIKSGTAPTIMPMASNGEVLWKDYGNRYFTAKYTALIGSRSCTFVLENHYILSASGIDENYGSTDGSTAGGASLDVFGPYILTKSARAKGAETSMYANYAVKSNTGTTYKTFTTYVQYVDINTSAGQIKVKHSWTVS